MIKSEVINIEKTSDFDNSTIEKELSKTYSNIIRWAIVDINEKYIKISVSHLV